MNTHMSKTILSIITLLFAGTILTAQTDDGSSAQFKYTGLYVEANYHSVTPKNADKALSYYGSTIGWRFNKWSKLQIEFNFGSNKGVSSTTSSTKRIYSNIPFPNGSLYSYTSESYTTVSSDSNSTTGAQLSYGFCFGFSKSRRFEICLTPTVGYLATSTGKQTTTNGTYNQCPTPYPSGFPYSSINGRRESSTTANGSSNGATTFGAGVGLTWHIFSGLYLDAGYRYLFSTSGKSGEKMGEAQWITGSLGWQF